MSITKKQKEVFDFICSYTHKHGLAPTQKEIKEHFGFKSFGSVQRYLKYLVSAGYLETDWNARRGIALTSESKTGFLSEQQVLSEQYEEIALLGSVAAGIPIEAIERPDDTIAIPTTMLNKGGKYYALNVQGDSMIEDGILDQDIIVCRYQNTANIGQTVIAVVDGEATVKRFHKKKNQIELIPANSSMKPIIVSPDQDFNIAGVLVGLIRNYE